MIIKNSIIPTLVWYTDYEWVTIKEALLHALQTAPNNKLTLPAIWCIRVNKNRILWSYWHAKMELVREWYDIENKMELVWWIMHSVYTLNNPHYNPDWTNE